MSTVAQRISRAAAEKGITLVELADRAQLSRSSVQRYASETTKEIPAVKLSRIAEVLQVPNDYLLSARAFENWDAIDQDRNGFLCAIKDRMGERRFFGGIMVLFDVNPEDPYSASLQEFTSLVYDLVRTAEVKDGHWSVQLKLKTENAPDVSVEGMSEDRAQLIELIKRMSDDQVRVLRAIADQVLSLRDK